MLKDKTVAIIGGSSGFGLRVAELVIAGGGQVILGGRSQERLDAAAARLGGVKAVRTVDSADKASIARFFEQIPSIDHLFTPGATYGLGRINEISDEVAESPFQSKFWGQYWAVKNALPKLSPSGSVVLMAGAAGARPPAGAAAYAAANSAIEGLGRALAVELAPIRVNVVSPGTIDGHLWRNRPEEQRKQAFEFASKATVLGRVGTEDEVARTVLFLFQNTYITGSTLYPDGGYALR